MCWEAEAEGRTGAEAEVAQAGQERAEVAAAVAEGRLAVASMSRTGSHLQAGAGRLQTHAERMIVCMSWPRRRQPQIQPEVSITDVLLPSA